MVAFTVTVSGPDPGGAIARDLAIAGEHWAAHLVGSAVLDIAVTVQTLSGLQIANASSAEVDVQPDGLYQESPTVELLTGSDPNGGAPDILVNVDPSKLQGTDPVTVFTHELAHALAFNGWLGTGDDETPYDALISGPASAPMFTGLAAEAIAGGPVPLAAGNAAHYAQAGLMNPYYSGIQSIAALDLAIASDAGVPVKERFGTLGSDTMQGSPGDDVAYGGYGNDILLGNQGADTLYGWAGDDTLYGGKGNDLLLGGDGNDVFHGGDGDDRMEGGAGLSQMFGEAGNDTVAGGANADLLRGGQGQDSLSGGAGNDTLYGDLGNDTLDGGGGADLFVFGPDSGDDVIEHFETQDRIQVLGAYGVSIDRAALTVTLSLGTSSVVIDQTDVFDAGWIVSA
jgi:Ca2+-binding RTX toxin-like protein